MHLLELFSGTGDVSQTAKNKYGMTVCRVEINKQEDAEFRDVFDLKLDELQVPDVIWASPPCTTFSPACRGYHREKGGEPITEDAIQGDLIAIHTLRIIEYFQKKNPKLVFFMENPVGQLYQRPYMQDFNQYKQQVAYCSYGMLYRKHTHIWTNSKTWKRRVGCQHYKLKQRHAKVINGREAGEVKEVGRIPPQLIDEVLSSLL